MSLKRSFRSSPPAPSRLAPAAVCSNDLKDLRRRWRSGASSLGNAADAVSPGGSSLRVWLELHRRLGLSAASTPALGHAYPMLINPLLAGTPGAIQAVPRPGSFSQSIRIMSLRPWSHGSAGGSASGPSSTPRPHQSHRAFRQSLWQFGDSHDGPTGLVFR